MSEYINTLAHQSLCCFIVVEGDNIFETMILLECT